MLKNYHIENLKFLSLSVLIIILDQLTKWFAVMHLLIGAPKPVLPFLNFTLAYNTGIAFSWFASPGQWHTAVIFWSTLIIVFILFLWLLKLPAEDRAKKICIGLIIGGAIGNMVDRVSMGYVIDFVDFYIGSWHYATFNVADTAICMGALFLMIQSFRNSRSKML